MCTRISRGFRQDCETFLAKFCSLESPTFANFAQIWREMCFSMVFSCRPTFQESKLFINESFMIVKELMFESDQRMYVLGCIYLLYGLYMKQPHIGLVKIRMTASDWNSFRNITNGFVTRQILQPVYVVARLLAQDAFEFVATPSTYKFGPNAQIPIERELKMGCVGDFEKQLHSMMYESGFLERLSSIESDYEFRKARVVDTHGQVLLNCSNSHLSLDLAQAVPLQADISSTQNQPEETTLERRIAIRQRAFSNPQNSALH